MGVSTMFLKKACKKKWMSGNLSFNFVELLYLDCQIKMGLK